MPRPKGSQNVANGNKGFPLSKRMETIRDLQKRMEDHMEVAVSQVSEALDKVYDDVRTLANSLPAGDRKETLMSTARTLRSLSGNLNKEEPAKRVASMVPDKNRSSDAILDDVERAV